MVRLAVWLFVLTAVVAFVGFYDMGGKSLAGHVSEVYRTTLVQQKVTALSRGLGERVDAAVRETKVLLDGRKAGKSAKRARRDEQARTSLNAPMAAAETPPQIIDVRPSHAAKTPAHDTLTSDDRAGLEKLLDEKLTREGSAQR